MRYMKFLPLLVIIVLTSSCYHAQIITDAEPSGEVIDQPWASGFIFGLVPPKEVRTASQCENGIAKVDTRISFLNGLVSAITFNIYTPMHITVACAESSMSASGAGSENEITVSKTSTDDEVVKAIQEASEKAVAFKTPIYVRFQ